MARKKYSTKLPALDVVKYGGKWIAWDQQVRKIVATGKTLKGVHRAALKAGEKDPVLEKVPEANQFFRI